MNNNTETIEQASDHSIYNINSEKETIIKCCNTLWVEKNPEFVERLVYAFYKRTEAIVKWQKEQDEAKYKALLDSHNELLERLEIVQEWLNQSSDIPVVEELNKVTKQLINKAKNI
jgi:uncharacterized protein (UPF0305 family)